MSIGEINFNILVDSQDEIQKFKTFSDDWNEATDLTDFKTAAIVLAEANGMEALVSLHMEYGKAMIILLVTEAENKHFSQEEGFTEDGLNCIEEGIEMGLAILARTGARFALRGLVQNCLQVNLQVSMQAISKASMPKHFDWFNGISLGITVIAVFLDIPEVISIFRFIQWLRMKVDELKRKDNRGFQKMESRISKMKWRFFRINIWVGLYVMFALHSLVKLYMALWDCRDGEWNLLGIWWNQNGCVDFNISKFNATKWQCDVSEYKCHYMS